MERVAVIDIGTVTARLAIADVDGEHVARLLKQSTICNLGEGLTQTGRISDVAAERVLTWRTLHSHTSTLAEAGPLPPARVVPGGRTPRDCLVLMARS